jgi:ABC-2 type transport system permease protein
MAALAAIGLAISTLTEHPIGAIAADPGARAGQRGNRQRAAVRRGASVPADALVAFVRRLAPVADRVAGPDARAGVVRRYVIIFGAIAWARFTTADVTS